MNSATAAALYDLLDHARRTTTSYAGLHEPRDDEDPADYLTRLPTLTRTDLQRDGFRMRAAVGDTTGWRLLRTTGTTGEPAEVVLDDRARLAEAAVLARHIDRCLGHRDWCSRPLIYLTLHPGAATRTHGAPWSAEGCVSKWNLIRAWQTGDTTFEQALRHLRATVVTLLPSVAELLALRVQTLDGRTLLSPDLMILSGETVDPSIRALVSATFGCPVTTLYTITEAGIPGSECLTDGGYHIEESTAIVELLDGAGQPVPLDIEGEVVVTPLANRAMVLLRYRTGDRATWAGPCRCGRSEPRIQLSAARRPSRLLTTTGQAVHAVRFAKLLGHLEVEKAELAQASDGTVTVRYRARQQLSPETRSIVEAALRAGLGPLTPVRFARQMAAQTSGAASELPGIVAEPDGLSAAELADWLQPILRPLPRLVAAALTGSCLEPESITRFSDIDLALFVETGDDDACWIELARRLRNHVPRFALTVDRFDGLPRRAPLFTCRLRHEQQAIVGRIDEQALSLPSKEDLQTEAQQWLQHGSVGLFQRLTTLGEALADPLRDAWFAAKHALHALRFVFSLADGGSTAATQVVTRAHAEMGDRSWWADFDEAYAVAREQRPPCLERSAGARYLEAALACIREAARRVSPPAKWGGD